MFNKNDIVRHRLVREIVDAYEKYYAKKSNIQEHKNGNNK